VLGDEAGEFGRRVINPAALAFGGFLHPGRDAFLALRFPEAPGNADALDVVDGFLKQMAEHIDADLGREIILPDFLEEIGPPVVKLEVVDVFVFPEQPPVIS
jgi:hypothetical protein